MLPGLLPATVAPATAGTEAIPRASPSSATATACACVGRMLKNPFALCSLHDAPGAMEEAKAEVFKIFWWCWWARLRGRVANPRPPHTQLRRRACVDNAWMASGRCGRMLAAMMAGPAHGARENGLGERNPRRNATLFPRQAPRVAAFMCSRLLPLWLRCRGQCTGLFQQLAQGHSGRGAGAGIPGWIVPVPSRICENTRKHQREQKSPPSRLMGEQKVSACFCRQFQIQRMPIYNVYVLISCSLLRNGYACAHTHAHTPRHMPNTGQQRGAALGPRLTRNRPDSPRSDQTLRVQEKRQPNQDAQHARRRHYQRDIRHQTHPRPQPVRLRRSGTTMPARGTRALVAAGCATKGNTNSSSLHVNQTHSKRPFTVRRLHSECAVTARSAADFFCILGPSFLAGLLRISYMYELGA